MPCHVPCPVPCHVPCHVPCMCRVCAVYVPCGAVFLMFSILFTYTSSPHLFFFTAETLHPPPSKSSPNNTHTTLIYPLNGGLPGLKRYLEDMKALPLKLYTTNPITYLGTSHVKISTEGEKPTVQFFDESGGESELLTGDRPNILGDTEMALNVNTEILLFNVLILTPPPSPPPYAFRLFLLRAPRRSKILLQILPRKIRRPPFKQFPLHPLDRLGR